jgi:hypothetical protein
MASIKGLGLLPWLLRGVVLFAAVHSLNLPDPPDASRSAAPTHQTRALSTEERVLVTTITVVGKAASIWDCMSDGIGSSPRAGASAISEDTKGGAEAPPLVESLCGMETTASRSPVPDPA